MKRLNNRKARNLAYQVARTCKRLNKRRGADYFYEKQQRELRKMLGF